MKFKEQELNQQTTNAITEGKVILKHPDLHMFRGESLRDFKKNVYSYRYEPDRLRT